MSDPKIAYLTAGAAGMYCGSCMHDNTLAAALHRVGAEITLIPTYTPIRTDEHNVSIDRVFFGGINVYLQERIPLFRHLPSLLSRWLDRPGLIRRATRSGIQADPELLGSMTVSMLRGTAGHQAAEVRRLVRWLNHDLQPDLVNFTNILIAGCVPELKRCSSRPVPIVVTLQGDDIFLESLPKKHRAAAIDQIRKLGNEIDAFVVFSQFYAEAMASYLGLPQDKMHVLPLGISLEGFSSGPRAADTAHSSGRSIGYLARLAPEKGLHLLVDAFIRLRQQPDMNDVRLEIAGWLGAHQQGYADEQFGRLRAAGLGEAFRYHGSIDRDEKIKFLEDLTVFSVPTTYRDPKGLFVLESLAAGVPVVQPRHGAFPELLESTGGGLLHQPDDANDLAQQLRSLLQDEQLARELGTQGQASVHSRHNDTIMAQATMQFYREVCSRISAGTR